MKLEVKNLDVTLQKDEILKGLSLSVREGEFLSLLGPSGCGKSTLLKTIAGLVPVDSGSITLSGREITDLPPHKRGTVIVFQDLRLFPHMSAAENVAFPLKMQGVGKAERLSRASALLEKVQLAGYENRAVAMMSGGQQQRVALARALAAKPELLLLDEPFSSLDENLREDMRALVLSLHKEFGMTSILVTHDRGEALAMSDRIALMFDGEITQCGTPQEIYAQPSCRRAADYFGDGAYLPGRVEKGIFHSKDLSYPADFADGDYDMMLRSDALLADETGPLTLRVRSVQFCGATTVVTLEAESGAVWKKSFTKAPDWNAGDRVSFAVDTSKAIFFER